MQIEKFDHTKREGIYCPSLPVSSYSQIRAICDEMVPWLNENNGKFPIPYQLAYAVSHCQIAPMPWHFFVASSEFLLSNKVNRSKRDTLKNFYMPSQVIVNARILEIPEKLSVNKPVRKVVKKNGVMTPEITIVPSEEKNLIGVPEACMSFPNRTSKTMARYYRIKVRYQYPSKWFGLFWYLKTKTEWVEGLKAHVFQHEIEHAEGKNMFYKK